MSIPLESDWPMPGDNLHFPLLRRRGFTLIELLVVIGIVVLIAAAAVPMFRFITASRSVDNANNMVDSMVGRGRAQALVDYRNAGVFFFLDPVTDRTTMAMVEQAGDSFRDPDFYAYKGWTDGSDQMADSNYTGTVANSVGATSITYYDSTTTAGPSYAMALVATGAAPILSTNPQEWFFYSENPATNTAGTQVFTKLTNIRFTFAGPGPENNPPKNYDPASGTVNAPPLSPPWNGLPPTDLEIVSGTDVQVLPPGVGLQIINDTKGVSNIDRYLRTGVILFDNEGKFQSVPWSVSGTSTLAKLMTPTINTLGGWVGDLAADVNTNKLFSGFGVVLYDRATFLSLGFTEGDYLYPNGIFNANVSQSPWVSEQAEETWLDNNSLPLVVNRFNGALTKGE
jgi:prepilin-type N-terminal cleavage/methylation domain-containing protein